MRAYNPTHAFTLTTFSTSFLWVSYNRIIKIKRPKRCDYGQPTKIMMPVAMLLCANHSLFPLIQAKSHAETVADKDSAKTTEESAIKEKVS